MSGQDQFLDVVDRDEAEARFRAALSLDSLEREEVPLAEAWGRVLAEDVAAAVDVPSFDRSNFDGYAVRAADTYGAREEEPRRLKLLLEAVATGARPATTVEPGNAMSIATGGMMPRGADAIVMIEHAEVEGNHVRVVKASAPGFGVTFAGTDVAVGETVLRWGEQLTSRETGVLAAIGVDRVSVWRRPRVAIISTGDEIIAPGEPMQPGLVYDSNAQILADAVSELGAEPVRLGIVRDSLDELRSRLQRGLQTADVVLLSGGTSKGQGDLSYRVVAELSDPGIVAHGVALKPGKPLCLAASGGRAVVILPGFPTSAIFTFHEFVAPVILRLGGRTEQPRQNVAAKMAVKVNSDVGRREYLLVGLVPGAGGLAAYPMGKGSGSVTTYSRADGFVTIDRHQEIVEPGAAVEVTLLARDHRLADLVSIGSHCIGLDFLLGQLQQRGWHTKSLPVGSTAGLQAARRGECDIAGVHLLDPHTGEYNRPFLDDSLQLVRGYGRKQGIVFRSGDSRFEGQDAGQAVAAVKDDLQTVMVNRNQGSGTRILLDRLLDGARPTGYAVAAKSHNAVVASVAQGRADWGMAVETAARNAGLGFLPVQDEHYDFVVPKARANRPPVVAFVALLEDPAVRAKLSEMEFVLD